MKHVFISYKRDDFDFAENVKRCLEEASIKTWKDDHIHAGEEWRNQIDQAIKNAFAIVVIMTPDAKASEYVTYEWSFAVGMGIRIIPLKYKATKLHPRLEVFQYLDFTSNNNDHRPWKKLVAEIEEAAKVALLAPVGGVLSFIQQARAGLNGTDAQVRKEAIATLAQANTTEAQEILVELLTHPLADVRQHAAIALGDMHYRAAAPVLGTLLQREMVLMVRIAVIEALEQLNDAKALPILQEALPRAHPDEMLSIVKALGSFGDAAVVPALLTLYKQANTALRECIITTLSRVASAEAFPLLGEALQDAELVIGRSAARALLYMTSHEALHVLVEALCVMNKQRCESLVHEIAAHPTEQLILALDDAYQEHVSAQVLGADREQNARVRRRIIWTLGLLAHKKAVPTLLQSMDDEDVIVQRETIIAFKSIHDERVLPALITILRWRSEDYDEKTLLCVVQAVGQIGNISSVPHLQAILEAMLDRYTEVAVQIIQVIGSIGAYETMDYLKKVKYRITSEARYAPEKQQELIEAIEHAIGNVRARIA
ncbi:MAG: HEAT repeat domain-containing protein [Ktedonobacteraceae bacterium]|nr:HEAT repeat domain-containing protein [Ktedonobacteraceae bacterium]